MPEPALRLRALDKIHVSGVLRRRTQTLFGLSLEVMPGETYGLLGPNGAGKTTTQKILLGLLAPTAGRVEVLGRPAGDAEARRRIGFLPENPYFYHYLTGREFLTFCADLFVLPRAEVAGRVAELLELVKMAHAADVPMRRYSKGMLQRIGIAQALVNDPDLVFLDEPTSGLDPLGHQEISGIIRALQARGKTIFLNTHAMADVEALCHRVGILCRGRLIAEGTVAEVRGEHSSFEPAFVAHVQAASERFGGAA